MRDESTPTVSESEPDDDTDSVGCKLYHNLVTEADGDPRKTVEYGDLSEHARTVVRKTIQSGNHVFKYNGTNAPDVFEYGDVATAYGIVYCESQYRLHVKTNAGCSIE